MFEEGTDFKAAIDRYVSTWTKKYIFYTKPLGKTESEQRWPPVTPGS
jgi:hypothetical protein